MDFSSSVVAAELVDLAHDRLECRLGGIRLVLPPRRQLAAREKLVERDPPPGDTALDRPDRAAADLGRLLIGKAACTDEDERLALRLGKMHQGALHVAKLDMPVLARGSGEDLGSGDIVPFALEARPAHLAEKNVAKDDEGPGTHVGARLEALARCPCLQKRFLDEIV